MKMGEFLNRISAYGNTANIALFDNISEMMEVIDKYGDYSQCTRIGFSSELNIVESIFSPCFLDREVIEFRATGKDGYAVCLESDAE